MRFNTILKLFTLAFYLIFMVQEGFAQDEHHHDHDHEHDHHKHEAHGHANELSIALGVVPLQEEETELAPAIHLHYVKGIAFENRLGIGAGTEAILDEHRHLTFSVLGQYNVYKGLFAVYAPGILFVSGGEEESPRFAQHFELNYEFELGKIHIGPAVEFGMSGEDKHFFFGVHLGTSF